MEVMEMARFSVVGGLADEVATERLAGATDWLRRQPGFLSRTLLGPDAGGRWTDLVRWRSHVDAEAAMAAFGASPELAATRSVIDPSTVEVSHHPIVSASR